MRILVISDSHGNIERLKHVYDFAKGAGLDAIIHCGDWDTPDAVKIAKEVDMPIYGVLGNADIDPAIPASLKSADVIFNSDFLKLELGGRRIGVCHFPGKLKDAVMSQEYDALFHGHTHRRKNKVEGKTLVVNPGALHRTRESSFAIYDTDKNAVEFVDVAI